MYNGLLMHGFINDWSDMREGQDVAEVALAVDGPEGDDELRAALAERGKPGYLRLSNNDYTLDLYEKTLGRQSPDLADPLTGRLGATITEFDRIDASRVPIYVMTGWWDLAYVDDTISLFSSLTLPKRLLLGPWNHISFSTTVETRRWFDYWLKDIDNGVTSEPPIAYCTWSANGAVEWRSTLRWPVPDIAPRRFYLQSGDALTRERAHVTTPRGYRVDYTVTTGLRSRHRHAYRTLDIALPNLDERARGCAVWTSAPLDAPLEITGTAVLHLRIESTHADGGLVALLEDVAPDGTAHYVTEGVLNLVDRALASPPFPRASGAWHSTESATRAPFPIATAVDVAFELWAVSWRLPAGHRVRIALAGADRDNYTIPEHDPAPVLTVHQGGPRASFLELPTVADGPRLTQSISDAFADDSIKAPFEKYM
jgi:putative CocE/NonD family hydrolase